MKYGVLPPELEKFRSLNKAKDKYEQLANVMLLGQQFDAEVLLQAVSYANRTGSPTLDTVRFYLQAYGLSSDNQAKDAAELADTVVVDNPRLSDYDILLAKDDKQDE